MFISGSCSKPIRQRNRRRTVTLNFKFRWNSQIHVYRSQGESNLTSFHHCLELRFFHAQRCQALLCGSRFHSVCAPQSAPAIPSCSFFLRLNKIPCCTHGTKLNYRGFPHPLGRCFAVSAGTSLSWARYEESLTSRSVSCCFIFLRNRAPSSV